MCWPCACRYVVHLWTRGDGPSCAQADLRRTLDSLANAQDLGDMAAPPTASAQPRHETETAVAPATASVADASALPGREASQPRVIFLATYVTVACNPVRFEHLDALARCPGPSSALTHDDAIAAARSLYSRCVGKIGCHVPSLAARRARDGRDQRSGASALQYRPCSLPDILMYMQLVSRGFLWCVPTGSFAGG